MDFIIVAGPKARSSEGPDGRNCRCAAQGPMGGGHRGGHHYREGCPGAAGDGGMCGETGTPWHSIEGAMNGRYARPRATCRHCWTGAPIRTELTTCWACVRKARGRRHARRKRSGPGYPQAPFGGRAVSESDGSPHRAGRLADAEQLIERVTDGRGAEGSALRMLLIPIFVQEGRFKEAERLIKSRWQNLDAKGEGASEQAINLARLHMDLRWNPPPIDSVRTYLDQAGGLVPDDDRIWLGRANLAIRQGLYDQAARWIDACLRRRPDDRSAWQAQLDCGIERIGPPTRRPP